MLCYDFYENLLLSYTAAEGPITATLLPNWFALPAPVCGRLADLRKPATSIQGAIVSGYPQDKQMNQHEQPLNPAIAYDRLCAPCMSMSAHLL
jgi:hypothetical protein